MKQTTTTPAALVTDPICGMLIAPAEAAGSSRQGGTTHYFCSVSCKSEFDAGHGPSAAAAAEGSSCCGGGSCNRG